MAPSSEQFKIKLDAFEGPFDLLYELITSREIDIYEIRLAEITREYLNFIRRIKHFDVDLAGEFLLIAAVLLELKSKSLFPKNERVAEVELLDPNEAREILTNRLIEYKMFKNASVELLNRLDAFSRFFARTAELDEEWRMFKPDLIIDFSPQYLRDTLVRIIRNRQEIVDASHMISIRYTVEEKADEVISRLKHIPKLSFRQLTEHCDDRMEKVFFFLAILELLKLGAVDCEQFEIFGEISIRLQAESSDNESTVSSHYESTDDCRQTTGPAHAQ